MKILVASLSSDSWDPRPSRIANYLNNENNQITFSNCSDSTMKIDPALYVIGFPPKSVGMKSLSRKAFLYTKYRIQRATKALIYVFGPNKLSAILYCSNLVNKGYRLFLKKNLTEFSLVIVEDLALLPYVVKFKHSKTRIIYEAREFYSGQKSMYRSWRFVHSRMITKLEGKYINEVDCVVTVSKGLADILQSKYTLTEKPQVIYGIPKCPSKKAVNLKENKQLLFHGHVTYDRYLHLILPALALLPDYQLLIRGNIEKKYYSLLNNMISSLGIREQIIFEKPVPYDDLIYVASKSTFGILPWPNIYPQKKYAMPNKFFEYLAAELPIFCVEGSEMAKIVEGFQLGKLYDGTAIDLTKKILETSPKEQSKIVNNIRKFNSDYNYDSQMKKYYDLIYL